MRHINIRLPKSDVVGYMQTLWGYVGDGVDYIQASPTNAAMLEGIDPPLRGLSIKVSSTQGDEILTCVTKVAKEVEEDD